MPLDVAGEVDVDTEEQTLRTLHDDYFLLQPVSTFSMRANGPHWLSSLLQKSKPGVSWYPRHTLRAAKDVEQISVQLTSTRLLMHDLKVLLDCSITADQALTLAT